jgi:hypothetical protein
MYGFHGSENADCGCGFLSYDIMLYYRWLPMFWANYFHPKIEATDSSETLVTTYQA